MRLIAHRGNTDGPSKLENQPSHILAAIASGYDVEIDVWYIGNNLWLGHDSAQYLLSTDLLNSIKSKSWIHCKNLPALSYLSKFFPDANYFWHQTDDYTLTSRGYVWAYPGKTLDQRSVCVMPEHVNFLPSGTLECYGVCTDYIIQWSKYLQTHQRVA